MDRQEMARLWGDMADEGNWIPSWTESLAGLSAAEAATSPMKGAHSIWQEIAHVIFWRRVTLTLMSGGASPSGEEVEAHEFEMPKEQNETTWAKTLAELAQTHDLIAAAIGDEAVDVSRIPYHLIHDGYHLGRITQLRAAMGIEPPF